MDYATLTRLISSFEPELRPSDVESFQEHFSEPLESSPEPLIAAIIALGYETRKLRTVYFYKFPELFCEPSARLSTQREDWQVKMGGDGFFRVRLQEQGQVWVSFFHIHPEKQGSGLGRIWFPRVVRLLFLAGATSIVGQPNPRTRYPSRLPLTQKRLSAFYLKHGFRDLGNGWIRSDRPTELC